MTRENLDFTDACFDVDVPLPLLRVPEGKGSTMNADEAAREMYRVLPAPFPGVYDHKPWCAYLDSDPSEPCDCGYHATFGVVSATLEVR